jgi:hypothetical protein
MPRSYLELGYSLMVFGFSLLVLRARLRETPPGEKPIESDEFQRTQVFRRH